MIGHASKVLTLSLRLYKTVCVALSLIYHINFIRLCIAEYIEVMSKKFHLDAGIFWIHWFDVKFFAADDFDFFFIHVIFFNVICFEKAFSMLLVS